MAAGRAVAARQARCLGACRLSPCAGMGAAAAADLAAGDPDARQPRPPRLPLRGDARLSDARQRRPARRLAGARMDEAGLAGGVSRSRLCPAARGAAAASGRAAGRAAAAGAARWRTGHRGARPDRHGAAGAARLFAHPPVRGGAAPAGVAAERRAGSGGRGAVRARVGQAADRGHPRLLHGRRLPQGPAAVAGRRHQERGVGKLGAGRSRGVRSERAADAGRWNATWSRSTRRTTRRRGT